MPPELIWTLAAIAALGLAISLGSIGLDRRRDRKRTARIMALAMGDPHGGTD